MAEGSPCFTLVEPLSSRIQQQSLRSEGVGSGGNTVKKQIRNSGGVQLVQIDPQNPRRFVNAARVLTVEGNPDGMIFISLAGQRDTEKMFGDIDDVVARLMGAGSQGA